MAPREPSIRRGKPPLYDIEEVESKDISLPLPEYPIDIDGTSEKVVYKPSLFEKILNFLLCRGDLVDQELEAEPVSLIGLFRYASKWDHLMLLTGCVCAIIGGVSQPVLALICGRITNVLLVYPPTSPEFRKQGYECVYIFLGIFVFVMITNFIQYMCFHQVCTRIIAKTRHKYVWSILRQNAGWFDKNMSGALTTKLNDNMERIREGIGDKLGVLIGGFSMMAAAIVIGFIYEWRLALMMFGVAPACCVCMSLMARKMTSTTNAELEGVGKAGAIAEECLMGVRTVQAFNGQETMVDRYEAELEKGKIFAIWKGFWSGFFGGLFYFLLFSFMGAGALYGGYLLKIGIISNPGEVFIVVMAMLMGAYFMGLISPHLMVLLNARVAAATIYQTIDRVPDIDAYSDRGKKPQRVEGRVEFKNVHFRYPSRKQVKVLDGLNLTIEPGQTVALVGHSGCGKSTSVGLLTRLYECEAGNVLLDGEDVRELNIDWLRNTIGIVQQEPILFNDTVEANLKMGSLELSKEEMIRVCRMANAHDFIMKMPKGYETLIGDGGVQLSGGQKQRIAIARTLARDPKVLLLDEATSALDAQSESIVQEALNNASKGRSTIIIAHRLSTVREANKIVVFEKGQIAEEGSHEELVAMEGRYYQLVKAQQFKEEEGEELELDDDSFTISRSSRASTLMESKRSGKEAFIRHASLNDSLRRPTVISSVVDSTVDNLEAEAFAMEVQKTMEEDGQITAGFLDIYKNAHGNYTYMIIGFICALIRGMDLPSWTLLFAYVFTAFEFVPYGGKMMHRLAMSVIIHACVGFGLMIFQILSSVLFTTVSENLAIRFRVQSFRNLLYQDAGYFDNPEHTPGKLITRLASDAPNIKAVVDSRAMQVTYAAAAILACIIIAFINSWQVAILGTGITVLIFLAMTGLATIIMNESMEHIKHDEAGKTSIEIIENVRTIQLLTRTAEMYEKYEIASKKQKHSEFKKGIFEAMSFTLSQTFMYLMVTVSYALGIHTIYKEFQTPDKVFRAITAVMLSAEGVMSSSHYFPEFTKAKTSAGLLFSVINRKSKTGDPNQGEQLSIRGNLIFEDVQFTYPQRPKQPIMRGLQFSANRGQTVALVGPSGSGKSTCISMLERFYDTTGGAVKFDGTDLKRLNLCNLRSQMALVGQEPRLFAGTIKDNICFGLGEIPMEKIDQALELANCKRFLSNLPQGLDTEVGEKGTQLSGGQKQRIAIARALVRDPKILLLDEATSALDSESERAVQEALDRAREGRTCITIAHRLSSIQNADNIVYIEGGKVRESGTHSQLMQRKGRYYQLIKKQDLTT